MTKVEIPYLFGTKSPEHYLEICDAEFDGTRIGYCQKLADRLNSDVTWSAFEKAFPDIFPPPREGHELAKIFWGLRNGQEKGMKEAQERFRKAIFRLFEIDDNATFEMEWE